MPTSHPDLKLSSSKPARPTLAVALSRQQQDHEVDTSPLPLRSGAPPSNHPRAAFTLHDYMPGVCASVTQQKAQGETPPYPAAELYWWAAAHSLRHGRRNRARLRRRSSNLAPALHTCSNRRALSYSISRPCIRPRNQYGRQHPFFLRSICSSGHSYHCRILSQYGTFTDCWRKTQRRCLIR